MTYDDPTYNADADTERTELDCVMENKAMDAAIARKFQQPIPEPQWQRMLLINEHWRTDDLIQNLPQLKDRAQDALFYGKVQELMQPEPTAPVPTLVEMIQKIIDCVPVRTWRWIEQNAHLTGITPTISIPSQTLLDLRAALHAQAQAEPKETSTRYEVQYTRVAGSHEVYDTHNAPFGYPKPLTPHRIAELLNELDTLKS